MCSPTPSSEKGLTWESSANVVPEARLGARATTLPAIPAPRSLLSTQANPGHRRRLGWAPPSLQRARSPCACVCTGAKGTASGWTLGQEGEGAHQVYLSPGLKSRVILFFFRLCFRFKFLIDKGMLFFLLVPLPLWEEVVELAEEVTELVSSVSSAASSSASCSAECSLSSPPSFSRKGGSGSPTSWASSEPSSCISTGLADPSGVSSGLTDPASLLALAPPFFPGSSMEWSLGHCASGGQDMILTTCFFNRRFTWEGRPGRTGAVELQGRHGPTPGMGDTQAAWGGGGSYTHLGGLQG